MRRIALCLLALTAFAPAGGCGDDDGPALSADEFARQANAICKAGDAELGEAGKEILKDAGADELAAFYLDHAVPNAKNKLKGIAALNPPAEDRERVEKMLEAGRNATRTVEDGLKEQGAAYLTAKGPDPFKEFNAKARELDLSDCAGQS